MKTILNEIWEYLEGEFYSEQATRPSRELVQGIQQAIKHLERVTQERDTALADHVAMIQQCNKVNRELLVASKEAESWKQEYISGKADAEEADARADRLQVEVDELKTRVDHYLNQEPGQIGQ